MLCQESLEDTYQCISSKSLCIAHHPIVRTKTIYPPWPLPLETRSLWLLLCYTPPSLPHSSTTSPQSLQSFNHHESVGNRTVRNSLSDTKPQVYSNPREKGAKTLAPLSFLSSPIRSHLRRHEFIIAHICAAQEKKEKAAPSLLPRYAELRTCLRFSVPS